MVRADPKGNILAAACVWNDKYLANDCATFDLTKSKSLPISKDEIILPMNKNVKLVIPFRSKIISSLHSNNIINSSYKFNANRNICIAKNTSEFTSKTRQTRQREVKKFLANGGEIKPISCFTASDAMDIYDKLFCIRRGVHTKDLVYNKALLQDYPDKFFGHVLTHNGEPCAMQIIVKAETQYFICFDYINIGYDTNFSSLCLGTVLTWINLLAAQDLCDKKQKQMRFSFGKPTFTYKTRWCHQEPLGRIITF